MSNIKQGENSILLAVGVSIFHSLCFFDSLAALYFKYGINMSERTQKIIKKQREKFFELMEAQGLIKTKVGKND